MLAPGNRGAKFNYCLESHRKRTLKSLGNNSQIMDMFDKEKRTHFNPSYTIRIYFELKKVEIEVVDSKKLHHILIFPKHPKSKFIEQHTKDKFERKSPVGECSTKMAFLLKSVKIFALETETNYKWKIKVPLIYKIIQYAFLRNGEIFLFMVSLVTNLLIFTDFERGTGDDTTFVPATNYATIIIDITTFIEVGVSLFLGIFWFLLRYPESVKSRKLRRVEGLEEHEAEIAMKVRSWNDFKLDYLDSFIEKSVPQSLLAHFFFSL